MKKSIVRLLGMSVCLIGFGTGCDLENALRSLASAQGASQADPENEEDSDIGRDICEEAYQDCLSSSNDDADCEVDFDLCVADSEWPDDGHATDCDEGSDIGRDICENDYQDCLADGADEADCEVDFDLCVADSEWPDDGHPEN